MTENIIASKSNQRIDSFLASEIKDFSRSEIKKAILQKKVFVNGQETQPSYQVQEGDKIVFSPPEVESQFLKPQKMPLEIIYEDEKVLVINKKAEVVVHPGAGNKEGTLANGVLYYLQHQKDDLPQRVGIVHRLDKETSGIILVAKNNQTLDFLQSQFKNKKVDKKYYALVWGQLEHKKGIIDAPLARHRVYRQRFTISENGKEAITHYKVEKEFFSQELNQYLSLLEVSPQTGRTHQIRVHLSKLGYPIVGDKVYGKGRKKLDLALKVKRQMLHAFYLKIEIPEKGMKEFQIRFPEDMNSLCRAFQEVDF